MSDHWLVRPATIRLLWRILFVILAITVLAELVVESHPQFAIERIFGYGAWYGFLACAAMILFAKGLAVFLKRPDTYYDEEGAGD